PAPASSTIAGFPGVPAFQPPSMAVSEQATPMAVTPVPGPQTPPITGAAAPPTSEFVPAVLPEAHAGAPHAPVVAHASKVTGWRRIYSGRFLFFSILFHLIFGVTAAVVVVQTMQAKRKVTFNAVPVGVSPSQRALEHQVQMAKKQAGGGA